MQFRKEAHAMETINLPGLVRWFQHIDFPYKLGIWEKLFGRVLSPCGICWAQTGAGIPWKLDLGNSTHRWIVYGKYEGRSFLNWAQAFLPADGVIVDSGANIGQMLLYLAQWVSHGRVLAFEPGSEQAEWLAECLRFNEGLPVELVRRGLGASSVKLFLRNPSAAHVHGAQNYVSDDEGEQIQIVRLADELALRSISKVDLWKLDVEVYEIAALQGAEDLLKEKRIGALYVEMAGDNGLAIGEYMSRLNYNCYLFNSNGKLYQPKRLPNFVNGLFLPA
jgi:FkbM family methyltransferase